MSECMFMSECKIFPFLLLGIPTRTKILTEHIQSTVAQKNLQYSLSVIHSFLMRLML